MNITEEQVREVLEKHKMDYLMGHEIGDGFVKLLFPKNEYTIYADRVNYSGIDCGTRLGDYTYEEFRKGSFSITLRNAVEVISWHIANQQSQAHPPEPTLQEKVEEILKGAADVLGLKVTDNSVEFLDNSNPPMRYFVNANEISYEPQGLPRSRNTFTVREYQDTYGEIPKINAALPTIAALLSPPTLQEQIAEQQRVIEGLREEKDENWQELFEAEYQKHMKQRESCEEWRLKYLDMKQQYDNLKTNYQRINEELIRLRNRVKELQRENESLLDKFGPIDESECKAAEAETALTRIAQKAERMAEILIELNEAIL